MADLPDRADLVDTGANKTAIRDLIGDFRDFVAQIIGASAISTLTIASGTITPTGGVHAVDTESAASTDNLDVLDQTNLPDGSLVVLTGVDAGRVVTVRNNQGSTGKVLTKDGASVALNPATHIMLQRRGTVWQELERFYGTPAELRTWLGLGALATLSAVLTTHITDANVTTAKLASNAVTTAKITDANVTTAKLADGAVTTAKIADANVTTEKLESGNATPGNSKYYGTDGSGTKGFHTIPGGAAPVILIYTSGATWTKQSGLVRARITVIGGGAGGGTGQTDGSTAGGYGGGGGGGGYSTRVREAADLGSTESVTVGAGGATDTNGGTSSFGSHCSATGGTKGGAGNNGAAIGGGGGVGSSGDVNGYGGRGGAGSTTNSTGGIGGSSQQSQEQAQPGNNSNGSAATTVGCGGAGGSISLGLGSGGRLGGAGFRGVVIVEEFY